MSNFKCKFNLTRRPNAVYKLLAKALYFATEALLNFNINKKCNSHIDVNSALIVSG